MLPSNTLFDNLVEKKRWREVAPGVFMASLLNSHQCQLILDAIEDQSTLMNGSSGRPNSMQNYGIIVEDPGLSKWTGALMHGALKRLVIDRLRYLPHNEFCDHHAFLTIYRDDGNTDLPLHVDASHITLNICLHNDAQGAELVFTGSRCRSHVDDVSDRPPATVRFNRGDALIHIGNQRHFVTAIDSGCRKNLVIWYRLDGESVDHTNGWIKTHCPACNHTT